MQSKYVYFCVGLMNHSLVSDNITKPIYFPLKFWFCWDKSSHCDSENQLSWTLYNMSVYLLL